MQEGYPYQQERGFDVTEKAAQNEGTGKFTKMGMGLGIMTGIGGPIGSAVNGAFAGISQQPPAAAGQKFCDQCGTELTPDAAFCDNCGAPQSTQDCCGNCGFVFLKPGKFCPKYGTRRNGHE